MVFGDYNTTRVVEQYADRYSSWTWCPSDIRAALALRAESIRAHFPDMPEPCLWIVLLDAKHPLSNHLTSGLQTYHIDLLFLADGCALARKLHPWVDEIVWFCNAKQPWTLESTRAAKIFWGPPIRPSIRDLLRRLATLKFGQCVTLNFRQFSESAHQLSLWHPWPRFWTPENHHLFPSTVQARVRLLLLAQLDPGSLIGRLDKACLLEILCYNAGCDK